jgi:hypothetical protein
MKNSLLLLAVACLPASAAVNFGDSPALDQAGRISPLTSDYVYEKSVPLRTAQAEVPGSEMPDDKCPVEGCALRRGGPPSDMAEPRNPVRAIEREEAAKKSSSGGMFSWLKSPFALAGGGALIGGAIGWFAHGTVLGFALKGGLMGGLIGAAIGAIIGLLVSKLF